jgi:hypothetical protein
MGDGQREEVVNFSIFATVSIYSAYCRHRKPNHRKSPVITGVNLTELQD